MTQASPHAAARGLRARRPPAPRRLRAWLACAGLVALLAPASAASAQATPPGAEALEARFARMSPAQRVGQIFLVPFDGASVEAGSAAARLIERHQVGGLLLDPGRGNFGNGPDAPAQVAGLTAALQERALASGSGLPLLIALPQLGDAFPDSPLYGGMTPLPSPMALGATWRPEHAETIGAIVGEELAAVGLNLLLGPSLDVLLAPRSPSTGDLGTRSFGGSPAWVGRMGRRYIAGVHAGSQGRVATAAGSFPGIGSTDRSQSDEIAVVESSLDQLEAQELVPFVAAAQSPDAPEQVSDALVTSHVRYRAIQNQPDRPFSLDSGGLRYLQGQLPAVRAWRDPGADQAPAGGGLLISAGLGQASVRRYVDPDLADFSARRVIREALLAGNDLLTLSSVGPPGDSTADLANIEDGIAWLAGEYERDETVRARVDDAARRVLALKARLYGADFRPEAVLADPEAAAESTGRGGETVAAVARDAAVRLSPADSAAVRAPQPGDRLLFVVDARPQRECPDCPSYPSPDPEAVLSLVRQAYGPEGEGTARLRDGADVAAITFRDLKLWLQSEGYVAAEDTVALLEAGAEDLPTAEVGRRIAAATWLVFLMRDLRPAEAPASDALRLFLKADPAEAEGRPRVAVALGAPYHLDTTEIASLAAYYAVFARSAPFLATAVRAVFGDAPVHGASPVSVPGAGYDLAARLEPAADQAVSLEALGWDAAEPIALGTGVRVRTSPIRDTNGNVVPDGTPITFRRYHRADDVYLADELAGTVAGRAQIETRAEREGEIELTATGEGRPLGEALVIRVAGGPATGEGAALAGLPGALGRPTVAVDWGILLLSLSLVVLAGVVVYGADAEAARSPVRLVRLFLLSLAWGLAGYLLVAAGGIQLGALPGGGSLWPESWNPAYQAPILSFVFALVPLIPSLWRATRRAWGA